MGISGFLQTVRFFGVLVCVLTPLLAHSADRSHCHLQLIRGTTTTLGVQNPYLLIKSLLNSTEETPALLSSRSLQTILLQLPEIYDEHPGEIPPPYAVLIQMLDQKSCDEEVLIAALGSLNEIGHTLDSHAIIRFYEMIENHPKYDEEVELSLFHSITHLFKRPHDSFDHYLMNFLKNRTLTENQTLVFGKEILPLVSEENFLKILDLFLSHGANREIATVGVFSKFLKLQLGTKTQTQVFEILLQEFFNFKNITPKVKSLISEFIIITAYKRFQKDRSKSEAEIAYSLLEKILERNPLLTTVAVNQIIMLNNEAAYYSTSLTEPSNIATMRQMRLLRKTKSLLDSDVHPTAADLLEKNLLVLKKEMVH